MRAQYTPRTNSLQPRIWRTKPSQLASSTLPACQAASAASMTSRGCSSLTLSANDSPEWNSVVERVLIASW
jgi:hypothetical protein